MTFKNKKKLLLITYYFPPSGGGGVKRSVKFIKYLKRYGWDCVVLTVTKDSYFLIDDQYSRDLPKGTKIYRTKTLISKKRTDQFRLRSLKNAEDTKSTKGLTNKIFWLIRNWLCIPDVQIGWWIFALPQAVKIIRKHRIRIVCTVCPPYSVPIMGLFLKKLFNLKWIIDLKDPWTLASYTYFPSRINKRLNEKIEEKLFNYSDKIITVTDNIVKDYYTKYPKLSNNKFEVIPNGFDIDDAKGINVDINRKFSICYAGRIDLAGRNPKKLLNAISELIQENKISKNDLNIIFVGAGAEYWQQLILEQGLSEVAQFTGYVPQDQCLNFQASSDVLLLLGGGSKYEQTGKIFDYLLLKKPIIGIIREDSPAAEIIRATKTGVIVPQNEINKIKNAVYRFYIDHKNGKPLLTNENNKEIQKYNWNNHGIKIMRILDEIT